MFALWRSRSPINAYSVTIYSPSEKTLHFATAGWNVWTLTLLFQENKERNWYFSEVVTTVLIVVAHLSHAVFIPFSLWWADINWNLRRGHQWVRRITSCEESAQLPTSTWMFQNTQRSTEGDSCCDMKEYRVRATPPHHQVKIKNAAELQGIYYPCFSDFKENIFASHILYTPWTLVSCSCKVRIGCKALPSCLTVTICWQCCHCSSLLLISDDLSLNGTLSVIGVTFRHVIGWLDRCW